MRAETMANSLFTRVQSQFGFSLKDRLHIAPDVLMFRKKEDESVWKQDKSEMYEYQVFFDGEFVCFTSVRETLDMAYYKVMKGLLDLYKNKKIYWNKDMYELVRMPIIKPAPDLPKATTPEDKIVQEVIRKASKKYARRRKSIN